MSSRSQPSTETALPERILDAAAEVIARFGMRKASLEDIARTAGCARPTIYTHFPSRDALLGSLLLREVGRYLEALEELQSEGPLTPQTLEDSFVFTLRYIREHPTAQGVLGADPEAMLPLLRGSGGDVLGAVVEAVADLVSRQQEAGALRRDLDPRVIAEAFIRFTVSFVLVPKVAFDQTDEKAMRRLFRDALLEGLT